MEIGTNSVSTIKLGIILFMTFFMSNSFAVAENETKVKMQPKVLILSGFEVDEYSGDAPGELQYWVEGEQLTHRLNVIGAPTEIVYNDQGVFAAVCSQTSAKPSYLTTTPCSELVMALVLDKRFDFSHTYWIVNGLAGIDPKVGSIGSAVWAANVVDADAVRELGEEDRPEGWKYGVYAIGSSKPNLLPGSNADAGGWGGAKLTYSMNYQLNPALANWAYQISKQAVKLPDSADLQAFRAQFKQYPAAQTPPKILLGASLATARYWHGPQLTEWARDWVSMWTFGKDVFYTTAMEQAVYVGTLKRMADKGLLDFNRVMMVRGASNYCMPPPEHNVTDTVGDESLGSDPAFHAQYAAGHVVIKILLESWGKYEQSIPQLSE